MPHIALCSALLWSPVALHALTPHASPRLASVVCISPLAGTPVGGIPLYGAASWLLQPCSFASVGSTATGRDDPGRRGGAGPIAGNAGCNFRKDHE
ncbi:unnamed protein product [Parajaminaea phylloscopi]